MLDSESSIPVSVACSLSAKKFLQITFTQQQLHMNANGVFWCFFVFRKDHLSSRSFRSWNLCQMTATFQTSVTHSCITRQSGGKFSSSQDEMMCFSFEVLWVHVLFSERHQTPAMIGKKYLCFQVFLECNFAVFQDFPECYETCLRSQYT